MIRAQLQGESPLFGTLITIPSAAVAETLARSGFDWLWIDCEHGDIGVSQLAELSRAIGDQVPALVRIPGHEPSEVAGALDAGAAGVIVPHVETGEQCRALVDACYYPPAGCRSVGLGRAQGYGTRLDEYMQSANQRIALIPQIESRDAVENIRNIASVPGVTALMLGPYDLAGSLGHPGEPTHSEVAAAIAKVEEAARDSELPIGTFVASPAAAGSLVERGYKLIAVSSDMLFLIGVVESTLHALGR